MNSPRKLNFDTRFFFLRTGAEVEEKPTDEGERPRTSPNAHPERRLGALADGLTDFSGGHEADEDRDAALRPQLHLGALTDPRQLGER